MTPRLARPVSRTPARPERNALQGLLMVAAGYYVLAYLCVAVMRLSYPFELEWVEGLALEHVQRVLEGQPLYLTPSLAFVPLDYTPLYYWVAAGVARLLGPDFLALRLVSFLASLTCFVLLFAIVRHETRSRAAGFLSVGLFAAMYRLGGAWLDLARVDSLYLALLLSGVCLLRRGGSGLHIAVAAATLFALAFLAKQTAVLAVAPLLVWSVVVHRRWGLILTALFATLAGGTVLLLDSMTHGWFGYYIFRVAQGHQPDLTLAWRFPLHDLMPPLGIAAVLIGVAVVRRASRPRPDAWWFYGAALLGMLGSSWHLRLYVGSYDNALMPTHAAIALAASIAWKWIQRPDPGLRPTSRALARATTAALLVQFGVLWWNPMQQLPSTADREAYSGLVENLRRLPGRVFVSSHSYLTARAGKPSHANVLSFMDVVKGKQGPTEVALLQALRDTFASHAYPVLLMDNRDWLLDEARLAGYEVRAEAFNDRALAWPVTGMRTRPQWILVPKLVADSTR